jgi:hypothetical protein
MPKGQIFSALKIYYYVMMQRAQPAGRAANEQATQARQAAS